LWLLGYEVLRIIFGPRREEEKGEWKNFHNEELHNFSSSPNNVSRIKSRKMRWVSYVVKMGR
jgi:hypothetical protein